MKINNKECANRIERVMSELREIGEGLEPEVIYNRISKYEYENICLAREHLKSIISSADYESVRSDALAVLDILDNEWE